MLGVSLAAAFASAQSYPVRPVRVIVPFTAGSAIDTLARVIGQKLSDSWGQQMVIDNRVGANGIIGTEAAAKSPADGYTLYFGNISTLAVNPHLYSKLSYDPIKDFEPVSLTASIPVVQFDDDILRRSSGNEITRPRIETVARHTRLRDRRHLGQCG